MDSTLPYILGHENAGWVHEIGSAASTSVGDTVILHPAYLRAVSRLPGGRGHALHELAFPGLDRDGGMAEYLLTGERGAASSSTRATTPRTSPRSPTPASPPTTRSEGAAAADPGTRTAW